MRQKYAPTDKGDEVTDAVMEAWDKLPEEEQDALIAISLAFKDNLIKRHYANCNGSKHAGFGELSAIELLGKVGIFLAENVRRVVEA